MHNRVTLCENALDPASWETHECGDLRPFLVKHFGSWPVTAKIYLNRVGKDTDVTPYDEAGIERLGILNGHFFVVVYPAELDTIVLIVSIALSAASMLVGYLLRPSLPENQQNQSPTNSLSNRQNKERINGRIVDFYGTGWETPDLIGVPYRIFIGNKEVEYTYLCIGRGEYDIAQVRDDVTPIEQINGAGCEIYGPYTSPNSGDTPQVSYGEPINEPIKNVKQYSSVNGQTLRAPNANSFKANNNIRFTDSGIVEGSGDIDFTDFFDPGTGTNPKYLVIGNSDYNGTYLILDVNTTQIVLSDPGSVNVAWNSLSGETAYGSPTLLNSGDNYEGPFFIVDNTVSELWCNFVAQQGLYEVDSSGNQHAMAVTVQIEVTSIDNNYNAQGSPIYFQTTLKGSGVLRTMCGATLIVHLPVAGSCKVRARRLSNTDLRNGWNVVDQIQWRDLYGVSPLEQSDFGNVTTIQTVTWPTPQALSIKQRKINVLVERKITIGLETPPTIAASKNAADIIIAMALDPYIGRRAEFEIDRETINAVLGPGGEVETYFGTPLCSQFSYAFDDAKMSFEEMIAQVCQAVFCTAFRRGNVLSVVFEKETADSTILFNHRNKLPRSETRTVKFGTASENDGIDLDYIEPNAPNAQNIDSVYTLHFPEDGSAVAAKKITATGVRNRVQAWMLGWRLYNKLLYQNTMTQFDAMTEASLCVINERILVADNTRMDVQDGEVLVQDGLEITLSQPVKFIFGMPYSIFLQYYDGTIGSISIEQTEIYQTYDEPKVNFCDGSWICNGAIDCSNESSITINVSDKVVLHDAPAMALVLDTAKFARTTYMIVGVADQAASAFLVQEKDAKDGGQYGIKAINYDNRYYTHDQDYASSPRIIDEIMPGGGTSPGYDGSGSGYSEQASESVLVDGKTMPWVSADNASYPYGIGDGKPPVAIPIQTGEGESVAIAANAPGQATTWKPFTVSVMPSNTVQRSDEGSPVGAEGEQDHITGDTSDGNGYFPTHYTADKTTLGRCGIVGCWAKKNTPSSGKYQVVLPFVVGFGGNFTVPAGGVDTLLLGINDNKFSDNRGGFQVLVTQEGAAAAAAASTDPVPDTTIHTENPVVGSPPDFNITATVTYETFDYGSYIPFGAQFLIADITVIAGSGGGEGFSVRSNEYGEPSGYQVSASQTQVFRLNIPLTEIRTFQAIHTGGSGSSSVGTIVSYA